MPYYGITITKNERTNNYDNDKHDIQGLIDIIKNRKENQELSDIKYELTKTNLNRLHCHFLLVAKRPPYVKLKAYDTYIKEKKLNLNATKALKKNEAVNRWVSYCHKSDHRNILDDYENSYRPPEVRIL